MTAYRQMKPGYVPTPEEFAMMLHESARKSVLENKVLKKDGGNPIRFVEWNELPPEVREGRISSAEFLLKTYSIFEKQGNKVNADSNVLINMFDEITDKMVQTFKAKNHDYGSAFVDEGVVGVMLRMKEKLSRFISVSSKGVNLVTDEKLDDTLLDLAVYSVMALIVRGLNRAEGAWTPNVLGGVVRDGQNIFLGNISASDIPKLKELMQDKGKQIDNVVAVLKPSEKKIMAKEILEIKDDSTINKCVKCYTGPAAFYRVTDTTGKVIFKCPGEFLCDTCLGMMKRKHPTYMFEKA